MEFVSGFGWIAIVAVLVVLVIIVLIYVRARWVIADANEAIIITGGRGEPVIKVGGGAFTPPFRKADKFPLGIMTVKSSGGEATQSKTMVPVIVEWTAQLRADTSLDENGKINESLRNAVLGFTGYEGEDGVEGALKQTLEGEVRSVISTLTPEELVANKAGFAQQVDENVKESMAGLGYKLVSLNIGKVSDPNSYYDNLSAPDREDKRKTAANLTAEANQSISVRAAEADQASKAAEQIRDLAVSEQGRELALRQAAIKAETETAQADAAIAGQLQTELRNQELVERQGQVAVVREQQAQAAATARREVEVTEAETAQKKMEIQAGAAAEAARRTAQGEADAAVTRAQGESDAINRTTEAKARQIRETGLAEAEVKRAQGEAEAAAKKALGEAEADAQLRMAEALSANDGANLKVTLAEVEANARVIISTNVGQVMAEVGKNAKFVDFGGANGGEGDLLSRVIGNLPALLAKADVSSEGLLDTTLGGALGGLVAGIREGKAPVVPASVPAPEKVSEVPVQAPAVEAEADTAPSGKAATPKVTKPVATPSAVAPTTVLEPASAASKGLVVEEPVIAESDDVPVVASSGLGLQLDSATLREALDDAVDNGTSLVELAQRFGVDAGELEALLSQEFTPGELLKAGLQFGRERLGRRKK